MFRFFDFSKIIDRNFAFDFQEEINNTPKNNFFLFNCLRLGPGIPTEYFDRSIVKIYEKIAQTRKEQRKRNQTQWQKP